MPFLYDVCNVNIQLYAKELIWSQEGGEFSIFFSISYMLNSKKSIQPITFLIGT